MKKIPAIMTAVVALAIVCVAAALGVKMKNRASVSVSTAGDESRAAASESGRFSETQQSETGWYSDAFYNDTTSALPAATLPQVTATLPAIVSAPEQTAAAQSSQAAESETTLTKKATTVLTTIVNTAFNEAFSMPRVPKYINTNERNIDFNTASLASYKYDPDGDYYYTNDKDAWQKGFGYNQTYDKLAVVSAMYYDTVRTTFTYENKDWLIQIWKGQYGYYFVGEEIGVYTKKVGSSGQYSCAEKNDWLKMEMCFVWDENHDGNYKPRFKRPYTEYWWCTGFVIGYESAASMKNREQFRMIGHITFKSTEMAELFANKFEANGFRRVSMLDNNVKDTFVQIGPDVAFVWQSINQHVI